MLGLIITALSFAQAVELASTCITASKTATMCCQNPLSHETECLDDAAKALNKTLQAFQESITRPSAGLKDSTRQKKAQLQAYKDSAALNQNLAAACEKFVGDCTKHCDAIQMGETQAAAAHCRADEQAAAGFRAQAERDANLFKRGSRAR